MIASPGIRRWPAIFSILGPAVKSLSQALGELLYPPACLSCANMAVSESCRNLCPDCWRQILQAEVPPVVSGDSAHGFAWHLAAWHYGSVIRDVIAAMKYHDHRSLAAALGDLAAHRLHERADTIIPRARRTNWLLVPVPLHPRRRRERGFNQSELIALSLSRCWNIPVASHALRRVRYTRSQASLAATERASNLHDAFSSSRNNVVTGKSIILVDDVMTTGATARACAAVLHSMKAATVSVLTLARVTSA